MSHLMNQPKKTVVAGPTDPGFEEDPKWWLPVFPLHSGHYTEEYSHQPIGMYRTGRNGVRPVTALAIARTQYCCGVREIYGIDYGWHDPVEFCAFFVEHYGFEQSTGRRNGQYITRYTFKENNFRLGAHPYVLFESTGSGASDRPEECNYRTPNYGTPIAQYIINNSLGEVAKFGPHRNPSGSATLRLFVWTPNNQNLLVWYQKKRLERDLKQQEEREKIAQAAAEAKSMIDKATVEMARQEIEKPEERL